MPENSRLFGTLIRSPENIDVILDTALAAAAVLSFYKENLAASGWNELEEMHPGHGGFVHTGFRTFENHATYCKGPDGPAFSITAHERKQGRTDVRLDINFGTEYSPGTRVINYAHWRSQADFDTFLQRHGADFAQFARNASRIDPHTYEVVYLYERAGS